MASRRRTIVTASDHPIAKIIGLIAPIIILISMIVLSFAFKVTEIECYQNGQECGPDIKDKLKHLQNRPLLVTDYDKTMSQFENWQIKKILPNKLLIEVTQAKSNFYDVNGGQIIKVQEETLPEELNKKINSLFAELEKNNIETNSVRLENNIFIIELSPNLRALIDQEDPRTGAYKLSQILNNLKLNEVDLSIVEIDTRFRMPVLKTEKTQI